MDRIRKFFNRDSEAWGPLLLVALTLAVYVYRLDALSIRGEESRRITITHEMLNSGNWFEIRDEGQLFLERPPLCNWVIGWGILALGDDRQFAVRLPSVLSTLIMALVVYGCARTWQSRLGALTAGMAWLTMGQVLQIGRLAENDSLMTVTLGSAILCWECGYRVGWRPSVTWSVGYALTGLATLAKGIQGPVYFLACTGFYLLFIRRDWRFFFSRAHAIGLLAFAATLSVWQVPYLLMLGWDVTYLTWTREILKKTTITEWGPLLGHMTAYPFEVFGSMLPWSALLLWFAQPRFRRELPIQVKPAIQFLVCSFLITFPSVWLAQAARPRYFMPLMPCMAVLVGLVVDQLFARDQRTGDLRPWRVTARTLGVTSALVGVVTLIVSLLPMDLSLTTPWYFGVAFALLALGCGALVWQAGNRSTMTSVGSMVVAVALLFGMGYNLLLVNFYRSVTNDAEASIVEFRDHLPPNTRLVSIGGVHHLFRYHLRRPVERVEITDAARERFEYFCFDRPELAVKLDFGFAWEPVCEINCDRHLAKQPKDVVIIGRRLPDARTASAATEATVPK
ncbi:MAG: glycosyltransferase family 39 protein [Planctomycetes bacterium]|nr:glycosyltransferase family 39 protein [Planctomycetota bacterium]